MAMLARPFSEQAVLALQHLWRVGQERSVDLWVGAGVAYLARTDDEHTSDREVGIIDSARKASKIWEAAHVVTELDDQDEAKAGTAKPDDEDEDIDVWDLQQRNRGFGASDMAAATLTVGEHLHVLPNHSLFQSARPGEPLSGIRVSATDSPVVPTFIAAEVSGLPRNAPVEWWSTGIAGLTTHAGRQRIRVWPIERDVGRAASLTGIAIEHTSHPGAEDEDEDEDDEANADPSHHQKSVSFFFTLIIRLQLDQPLPIDLPETLDDLRTTLFKDNEAKMTSKIVTAQSFLNLSCQPHLRASLEKTQLVQQATLVPCHHVWASNVRIAGGKTTAVEALDGDALEEVAAAIVLRVDAYSR